MNFDEIDSKELKKFTLYFVLSGLLLFGILNWMPDAFFAPFNQFTATTAGFFLSLLDSSAVIQGVIVSCKGFSVRIITECSAIFASTLFLSFVMAYPATIKQKAIGLFLGIPVLFLCNAFRIVLVTLAGALKPALFDCIHVYIGQILMISVVFMACMVWLLYVLTVRLDDSILGFFIRFIALSSILFIFWLYLNRPYVRMGDYLIQLMFSLFNRQFTFNLGHTIYYHTFNLVTLGALILASRSISRRFKVTGLIIGFAIVFLTHILFRLCNVFITGFNLPSAFKVSSAISIVSQYLLPVAIWLAVLYYDLLSQQKPERCPFCGAEKVGLVHHIRAKHGKEAMRKGSDTVTAFEGKKGKACWKAKGGK
ncbi:MAG: exosortase H [Chloroflexota bacterium]